MGGLLILGKRRMSGGGGAVSVGPNGAVTIAPASGSRLAVSTIQTMADDTRTFDIYMAAQAGSGISGAQYPVRFFYSVESTDLSASDLVTAGVYSGVTFGNGAVASKGTAHGFTTDVIISGSGDAANEYAAYMGVIRADIGTGFTQSAGPIGNIWFTDWAVHGPIAAQPDKLTGINMVLNNHYNGVPVDGASFAAALMTHPDIGGAMDATHQAATTYPVGVGLVVAGRSNTSASPTGVGFTTGIRVGGSVSSWDAISASIIGTGIELLDWRTYGINISGREASGTGPAIRVAAASGEVVVGHSAALTFGSKAALQVLGTDDAGSTLIVGRFDTDDGDAPTIGLFKGGDGTIGSNTAVAQGESLGNVAWYADDGTDFANLAGRIWMIVTAGTGSNDVPTNMLFETRTSGAGSPSIRGGFNRLGNFWVGTSAAMDVNNMTGAGLFVNQEGNDTLAFALIDTTDVATGLTSGTGLQDVSTNTYYTLSKFAAATGGTLMQVLGENAAVSTNFRLESYGGQASTTHSTSGRALVEFYASQHDGSNGLSDIAADGNVFGFIARVGTADRTIGLLDEDGEFHLDAAVPTAFDAYEDVALGRALTHVLAPDTAIRNQWDQFVTYNEATLVELGILGDTRANGGLLNINRLLMLLNGMAWQQHSDLMAIAATLSPDQQARLPGRMQARLVG